MKSWKIKNLVRVVYLSLTPLKDPGRGSAKYKIHRGIIHSLNIPLYNLFSYSCSDDFFFKVSFKVMSHSLL